MPAHNPPCKVSVEYKSGECRVCWLELYDPRKNTALPTLSATPRIQTSGGVGTELARILSWFGFSKDADCKCGERAAEMDRRGVAWCEVNTETILDWLADSARERKIPFVRFAASLAVKAAISAAKVKLSDEQLFPCIHRGTERVKAKGCNSCSGIQYAYSCSNEKTGAESCIVNGSVKAVATARSNGYLVCSECGFREPEEQLEMPVAQLRVKLEEPRSSLPFEWPEWKAAKHAVRESFLEVCSTAFLPPKKINGRGVVIAAGGDVYFPGAWAVTNVLRSVGCTLPIQWWYLGKHEMDARMLQFASELGVTAIDSTPFTDFRNQGGWELKPLSVLMSGFEEVLYLDADCVPTTNPEYLFDSPEFQKHGSVFWPDLPQPNGKPWVENNVWELFGLTPDPTPDFESGQFLVDVRRCWKELQATLWLNNHSEYVYKHVYGDKSTFHLAWRGCSRQYGMPSTPAGWKRPCIQQHDFDGKLAFNHACQGKLFLGHGVLIPGIANGETAADSVKQLRQKWRGLYAAYPKLNRYAFRLSCADAVWDVFLDKNRKLKGGPPFLNQWGWDADREQIVLIGNRGKNKAAVDFLSKTDSGWQGENYSLT